MICHPRLSWSCAAVLPRWTSLWLLWPHPDLVLAPQVVVQCGGGGLLENLSAVLAFWSLLLVVNEKVLPHQGSSVEGWLPTISGGALCTSCGLHPGSLMLQRAPSWKLRSSATSVSEEKHMGQILALIEQKTILVTYILVPRHSFNPNLVVTGLLDCAGPTLALLLAGPLTCIRWPNGADGTRPGHVSHEPLDLVQGPEEARVEIRRPFASASALFLGSGGRGVARSRN